jgi:uncharacterized protein
MGRRLLRTVGLALFWACCGGGMQWGAGDYGSAGAAPAASARSAEDAASPTRPDEVAAGPDEVALGGAAGVKATPRYQEEKRQVNSHIVSAVASGSSSAYTRLIEDLADVLEGGDATQLRLIPMLGRGGGQNFRDILFTRGVDMGVTDAEYMNYFSKQDPVLYGGLDQRVTYIAKLCNAEFHILAKKDVRAVSDLKGRKVNFWKPLSITALAAERIFKTIGVDVVPTFYDNAVALEKLRSGEIAAMTRMSAAPHGDYDSVTPDDGFHLVSLYDAGLPEEKFNKLLSTYVPAEMDSALYPKLIESNERILTVAGNIVLAAYAWPENSERYKKLAAFVNAFFDNVEKLHQPGRHPKWREFSIEASVPGWTRFKPSQEWIDAHKPDASNGSRKLENAMTFKEFMSEYERTAGHRALTSKEQRALYQSFLKWSGVKAVKKN